MGYKYWKDIKNNDELGMSDEGSITALENDINGIVGYIKLLTSGGGIASKVDGPLGERYFQKTMGTCVDSITGETVPRYIYVDYIPDGSIPFISGSKNGPKMTAFEGLIPGALTNIAHISAENMIEDLTQGPNPKCKEACLLVGSSTSKKYECNYLTLSDIDSINNSLFQKNTDGSGNDAKEGFSKIENSVLDILNFLNLKNIDSFLFKTYFSLLGVFGLYLLFRFAQKMRHKL